MIELREFFTPEAATNALANVLTARIRRVTHRPLDSSSIEKSRSATPAFSPTPLSIATLNRAAETSCWSRTKVVLTEEHSNSDLLTEALTSHPPVDFLNPDSRPAAAPDHSPLFDAVVLEVGRTCGSAALGSTSIKGRVGSTHIGQSSNRQSSLTLTTLKASCPSPQ